MRVKQLDEIGFAADRGFQANASEAENVGTAAFAQRHRRAPQHVLRHARCVMLLPNSAKLGFVHERGAVFSPSAIASMLAP